MLTRTLSASLAYVPALLLLAAVGLSQYSANLYLGALLPLVFLYALLPLLDYLIGLDTRNPDRAEEQQLRHSRLLRLLPVLALPVQLVLLFGTLIWLQGRDDLSIQALLLWAISLGVVSGINAINTAHELIHRPGRTERITGGILLSLVCYGGFKIEHIRGHHVNVATPLDNSSARLNQSVYNFVFRALRHNLYQAWLLEKQRLAHQHLPAWHWRNEVLDWYALSLLVACSCYVLAGWTGVLFFLLQSLIAVIELEVINYIEHYGLQRARQANGRYQRPTEMHSWNSSYRLSNLLLLQLQRHADHHANPNRPYPLLRHLDHSPQLPGGYASMMLLALIPPLWRRVIHPRLPQQPDRRGNVIPG
ncbi:hypothetical protein AT746_01950 [Lacimicrobium alkaliphilum]|uniref:Fatty acid desaturase domain-containing protein n=1 Tax=Lacimicrobium alkaliphilum TaxID=1526571 RepID=A0A0U2ZBH0_9ALTE|nr:hypothetical protein AT746_01950 [Lacimicrobium alkaliphilum]